MKKFKYLIFNIILIVVACSTNQPADEYTIVANDYNKDSIEYSQAATKIQSARAAGNVTDLQYSQFQISSVEVRRLDNLVFSDLNTWKSTGTKPPTFEFNFYELKKYQNNVIAIAREVSK
jgi:hypothetical protein